MVDWFVKFGGGETCFFVDHLVEFCRVSGVLGQPHIPGRVFASLAALKFDTQLPGHASCAVLKRAAMSKKVADGIAQDLQASQISQFGGKKAVQCISRSRWHPPKELEGALRKASPRGPVHN